ncbi:hypothetical protein ERJ77_00200 [Vibrio anguillarum]|uniref:Uncharacterized protein n=1 Tax=Vibrio anguillarum TaxID=55601 RepID=A0AAW4B3S2_VIBAN|nr:hypothetical protein [Vibrio anguillarum]
MASEKLTKHRFAQILITLLILLVAFFWRTFSYQNVDMTSCTPTPNCSVFVNEQEIIVIKDDKNPNQYIIGPRIPELEIHTNGTLIQHSDHWIIQPNSSNKPITFKIIGKRSSI